MDVYTNDEERLPKGLKLYKGKNDESVEWDIYVQGASGKWLKPNQTYQNVFNIVEDMYVTLVRMGYKVAYGYFKVTGTMYMRGSYLVKDSRVVDVGRHFYREKVEMEYIMVAEIDIQDYIKMVMDGKGKLNLKGFLTDRDSLFEGYAKEKGIRIIE